MAFKIAPFPGQTYGPSYARNEDIKAYFGFGRLVERQLNSYDGPKTYMGLDAGKVPADFMGTATVPLTDGRTVLLAYEEGFRHSNGRKSSKHRVHARCPDCSAWVPAGRTHQHKCKE